MRGIINQSSSKLYRPITSRVVKNHRENSGQKLAEEYPGQSHPTHDLALLVSILEPVMKAQTDLAAQKHASGMEFQAI